MRKTALIGALVSLASVSTADAQLVRVNGPISNATKITFNALAANTPISNQFASQGLTISSSCFRAQTYYSASLYGGDPVQAANSDANGLDCHEHSAYPTVTFNFSSMINYFGFIGASYSNIKLTDNNGNISIYAPPIPGGTFVGFIDADGFNTVTVSALGNQPNSALAIDDVTFGVQVVATPEPASAALLLTGFVAIGAVARRKRVQG